VEKDDKTMPTCTFSTRRWCHSWSRRRCSVCRLCNCMQKHTRWITKETVSLHL